jgi:DNA-directed RNA polymerase subunit RPC12/RpoP
MSNSKVEYKTIQLGQSFASYAEFKKSLDRYCCLTNQMLTIIDSHKMQTSSPSKIPLLEKFVYRYATFGCIHYGNPYEGKRGKMAKTSAEKRENTRSLKIGCPCSLRITYKEKSKDLVITNFDFNLEHNHPISNELYKQ